MPAESRLLVGAFGEECGRLADYYEQGGDD